MVQEIEKYRDEDEANESKYEAENGLEKFRVTVCNTPTEGNPRRSLRVVTDTGEDMVRILITNASQTKMILQLVHLLCGGGAAAIVSSIFVVTVTLPSVKLNRLLPLHVEVLALAPLSVQS